MTQGALGTPRLHPTDILLPNIFLGGVFLLAAVRVWRDDKERHCRQLFGFSILYLFAIFAILLVDRGIAVL